MADKDKFRLSDTDSKFMIRFAKARQRSRITYVATAFIFIFAAIQLALAIRFGYTIYYLIAFIFVVLGITAIIVSGKYKRLYSIIKQMQDYIDKLDDAESQ